MFTLNLDKDKYILSISHTKNDNVEIDLSLLDLKYLNCYKFINSEVILDETKKAEMIAEEESKSKAEEIADLQQKLNDSDYIIARTFEEIMSLDNSITFIADFIKIIKQFKTQYAEVLANRKTWRERIEELEK